MKSELKIFIIFRLTKGIFSHIIGLKIERIREMSIKKISSPISGGADAVEQTGAKEVLNDGKVEKSFEAALAEVAGQIEKTGTTEKTENPAQIVLRQIAENLNLDSPDEVMSAVRESANFIVNSRLEEKFRDTEQGKKITSDLSEYISNDPFMYRKILGVLQKLK